MKIKNWITFVRFEFLAALTVKSKPTVIRICDTVWSGS
jgi:hypothetical protein